MSSQLNCHSTVLRTDLRLSEQLKVTDRDIKYRKKLLQFEEEDVKYLVECKEYIAENMIPLLPSFIKNNDLSQKLTW